MCEGTIKMPTDKGYGFIHMEKGALLLHLSAVPDIPCDEFREGETVEHEACRLPHLAGSIESQFLVV